jgi:hypothetical protein
MALCCASAAQRCAAHPLPAAACDPTQTHTQALHARIKRESKERAAAALVALFAGTFNADHLQDLKDLGLMKQAAQLAQQAGVCIGVSGTTTPEPAAAEDEEAEPAAAQDEEARPTAAEDEEAMPEWAEDEEAMPEWAEDEEARPTAAEDEEAMPEWA